MQTIRRARVIVPLALLLVALVAAACSSRIPVPIPLATGPRVTVELVALSTALGPFVPFPAS